MLSVRLPETLEGQLAAYCRQSGLSKSQVVQTALTKLLHSNEPKPVLDPKNPLAKWVGVIKGGMSTDELMRMTRGDDWNKP